MNACRPFVRPWPTSVKLICSTSLRVPPASLGPIESFCPPPFRKPGSSFLLAMEKDSPPVQVVEDGSPQPFEVAKKWKGTAADQHDMLVIGRKQQLRRNFHLISILGFGCNLICGWEINVTTLGLTLTNGGTAGMIYGFILTIFGFTFVYASLAEMASMSPTAGGQYHWVSEFSPRSCQKYLSYLSGWLCFTGWQAAIGSIAFLVGSTVQALIVLHRPDTYIYEAWHGTLLVIAIVLSAFLFNSVLAKRLPLVEGLVLLVHVCGMFAICIPLWALSSRKSAHAVFTEFTNSGGWSTTGLSFMVGLTPLTGSMAGIDSVVHMAEEIKDASKTLPRTIMTALPLNATLGLITIITLAFCTVNVDNVLSSPTGLMGFPFIEVFYEATGSLAGTTVMAVIPMISLFGSVVAEVATASRQIWAFARDGGVPFSSRLAKVHPRWTIPLNAILVSLVVNLLLPLINIGSTAALNAIFSLSGVSILCSYILCIGSILIKRLRNEPLPPCGWSLGRYGIFINIVALCYLVPVALFQFFPPIIPVAAVSMNWGCLLFGSMIIFSTTYYVIYGRKTYIPPVMRIRRDI
ncbi:amino acid permease-domain-containing protein [Clohesyomyces aquaticus]|uniref:Amino acid permease-domain-containing protein n=1 Tax=Clohesyomyces aquaticus TaxID=1231657 RepID=A0A1Y1YHK9_9PLEO|nr:amino acid permease-domain-containing protein [Clohesyomyces aquaticus]